MEGIRSIKLAQERLKTIDKELDSLSDLHRSLAVDENKDFKPSSSVLTRLPQSLFECNILAALTQLTEQLLEHHLVITFNHMGVPINLDLDRGTLLMRCIQICLDLIVQHLDAGHILIELSFYPTTIELYLEDDGTPINLNHSRISMIWQDLQTKVRFMDGFLKFQTILDRGNIFNLMVPRFGTIK